MKMKTLRIALAGIALGMMASCGTSDDDVSLNLNLDGDLGLGKPADDCLDFGANDLILSIQDQFTTLPGKVSVFFRVSDASGNPVAGLTADQFTIYEQGRNDACFNTISASESLGPHFAQFPDFHEPYPARARPEQQRAQRQPERIEDGIDQLYR